jgi:hypothetical protein
MKTLPCLSKKRRDKVGCPIPGEKLNQWPTARPRLFPNLTPLPKSFKPAAPFRLIFPLHRGLSPVIARFLRELNLPLADFTQKSYALKLLVP